MGSIWRHTFFIEYFYVNHISLCNQMDNSLFSKWFFTYIYIIDCLITTICYNTCSLIVLSLISLELRALLILLGIDNFARSTLFQSISSLGAPLFFTTLGPSVLLDCISTFESWSTIITMTSRHAMVPIAKFCLLRYLLENDIFDIYKSKWLK